MYSSMHAKAPPPDEESTEKTPADAETVDGENADNPTCLVPKSMLGGARKGDTITMRIVADHGDECELAYQGGETESKPKEDYERELDDLDSGKD